MAADGASDADKETLAQRLALTTFFDNFGFKPTAFLAGEMKGAENVVNGLIGIVTDPLGVAREMNDGFNAFFDQPGPILKAFGSYLVEKAETSEGQGELVGTVLATYATGRLMAEPFRTAPTGELFTETSQSIPKSPRGLAERLTAGAEEDINGLTKAGRALEKHGSRPGSAFPQATGNVAAKNVQGAQVLDDLLRSNSQSIKPNRFGGQDIFDNNTGRGVRFDGSGKMMGFLEPG